MAACVQKMEKFKPHLAQVAVQIAYAGMNVLTKLALADGMNHFVFVTYRQIIATLAIAPLAYVLERKQRPPMTLSIFFQIFLLALGGIAINQNFYFAGLNYTNSTFAAATTNLIPVVTFVMATVLRYENVNIRSLRGLAKVVGTIVCVGGAMVMTLYKGSVIKMLNAYNSIASNNILGSILLFASVFAWSSWIIFQAPVVKKYPAQLSLTAMMCMFGALQSGVIALIFEHNTSSVWTIGWNLELLSYVYTGLICSAFAFFVQTWCVHLKGPVFAAVFNPLNTIVVAILECFILHASLHVGSVVGSVLIVGGLYSVLWGKAKDHKINNQGNSTEVNPSKNNNMAGDAENQETAIAIRQPLLLNGSNY
eukprot:PITA_09772